MMKKRGFGQRLRRLHSANAWIIALLAVSGILLYLPPMRALLGGGRVWLKQLHIAAGLVSLALVLIYVPHIRRHFRQLSARKGQQANLVIVLLLLAGWIVSGVILWRFRSFPPAWNNSALLIHDLFTWIGLPYAVYHSVTRSRWLKDAGKSSFSARTEPRPAVQEGAAPAASAMPAGVMDIGTYEPATGRLLRRFSRRTFMKIGVGSVLAVIIGPSFFRWLSSVLGSSNLSSLQDSDAYAPGIPQPTPLPDSLPPKGGGAQGRFRIYTVTDIPDFKPDQWLFRVDGLVERPIKWSWTEFLASPRVVQVSDFHCVTGWSVTSCTWEGIPLNRLLEQAGVKNTAKMVKFYSSDGEYTDAITIEQTWMEDVMVAVMLDGKLIPKDLGGPVRLVVPQMFGYKSVKWLNRIELIDSDHTGYWEKRGYSKDAWVWVKPM